MSFNPRLRAGGDGARIAPDIRDYSFNPRLRAGGDCRKTKARTPLTAFQPTPPRGRRRGRDKGTARRRKFQPTPPRGRRRDAIRDTPLADSVSTHASAREATPARRLSRAFLLPFQPTPPRGRRRAGPRFASTALCCFNPRLRAGGDGRTTRDARTVLGFNPRLRAGGDGILPASGFGLRAVSTHASAREATTSRSSYP